MYVLGYSENFTGEDAKRFIREAADILRFDSNIREALERGTVGHQRFDIDSIDLLFVPESGFHVVNSDGTKASGGRYLKCACCGVWKKLNSSGSIRAADGKHFCSATCATNSGYVICVECGCWYHKDSGYEIGDEHLCSYSCAEDHGYCRCEDCDEWCRSDDLTWIRDHGYVCDDCYSYNDYHYCSSCSCHVRCDEFDHDEEQCYHCSNNNCGGYLHSYGYAPMIEFFGSTDGNTKPYLGIELETDGGSKRGKYARDLAALDLFPRFWMTRDSSIENGIEVTSHPMTLDEHIKCGLWEDVARTAIANGFGSHNGGRCGLHIHINRGFFGKSRNAQEVGGYKMMRLMQRFEQQFITFSRRTSTRWCSFNTNYKYGLEPVKVDIKTGSDPYEDKVTGVIGKAERMNYNEQSHSQAVNFEHDNTFEIRIFRGTLRIPTLYASFALANGLARACKSHGEAWVERVDWYGLMEWIIADCDNETARTHLKNYLAEKELYVPADFILANHTITEEN